MLTSKKLTYCIVFVAVTCLLASLGLRPLFAKGSQLKSKTSSRAIIEEDNKFNEQIVRDSHASDTPCVSCQVTLVFSLVTTGTLQPIALVSPPHSPSQNVSSSRAPPHHLS